GANKLVSRPAPAGRITGGGPTARRRPAVVPARAGTRLMNDSQIRDGVEAVLRESSRVDWREGDVQVADAVVTLTGFLDSTREKRTARQLAEGVNGVKYVNDQMQVKDFVARPDAELAEEVRHALLRDAYVEGAQIEVYARGGEIQLDGSVP